MSDTMKLVGGPFDGAELQRPAWRWQSFLVEDKETTDVVHRYRPTRDPDVWRYAGPDHVVARIEAPRNPRCFSDGTPI